MFLEVAQCRGTGCVHTFDLLGAELEIGFVCERPGLLLKYMSSVLMAYSLVCLPQHSLCSMKHCNTPCENTNLFTLVELLNIRIILCSRKRY